MTTMSNDPPDYMTYLLRLWRAGGANEPYWRAALENPRTGERQAFSDLASLFAFLEEKTGLVSHGPQDTPPVSDRRIQDAD